MTSPVSKSRDDGADRHAQLDVGAPTSVAIRALALSPFFARWMRA